MWHTLGIFCCCWTIALAFSVSEEAGPILQKKTFLNNWSRILQPNALFVNSVKALKGHRFYCYTFIVICRLPSKELRERLGVDDIALVLQQNRLRWYSHMLRKDDDDWVKKCMGYEVEGSRPRGRPKKTWKEVVREDCQARMLNKEDAMDRCKWRKVIKEAR